MTDTEEFDDAELVLEYDTGVAHRAVVVRESQDEVKTPYRQEDWSLGADGWRLTGYRPVEEYEFEQ